MLYYQLATRREVLGSLVSLLAAGCAGMRDDEQVPDRQPYRYAGNERPPSNEPPDDRFQNYLAAGSPRPDLAPEAPDLNQIYESINRWMIDIQGWGRAVREDITELERALGMEPGDPGDPPPKPWR